MPLTTQEHRWVSMGNLVHGCHSGLHVFIDVAVEHPHPDGFANHVGGHELRRQQGKDVGAVSSNGNHVPMPVGGMDIDFATQGHHIPAYVLSALHDEHGQIAEHITVNAGLEIGGSETVGGSIEIAVNIARNELEFIRRFRFWVRYQYCVASRAIDFRRST